MDNAEAKKLIAEKLFIYFIPKIMNNTQIIKPGFNTWSPNYYLVESEARKRNERNKIELEIIYDNCKFNICHLIIITRTRNYNPITLRLDDPTEERTAYVYETEKDAIKGLSENVELTQIMKMALGAMAELDYDKNPANLGTGAIKKILNLNEDIDLFNLEKRNVLLEILR